MTKKITNYFFWNKSENVQDSKFTTPLPSKSFLTKYIPKGGKVLDFGCGYGRLTKLLVEYGYDVTAVDISRPLVDQAKKLCPDAKYRVFSLQEYDPEPDGPFDGILILAVIENIISLKERRDLADKVSRSLKTGGVLILETFIYDERNNEQYVSSRIRGKTKGVFFVKRGKTKLVLFNDTKDRIDKLFIGKKLNKCYGKEMDFITWSNEKQKGYIAIYKK
ncbi:MAG: class I SAM-dependent methyltransferase [Patescibacteria group bacterium]|mgnify:CR=1 FL=1